MSGLREISEITANSATEAVRVYFEPLAKLRIFRPFFDRSALGFSRLGRMSILSVAAALVLATVWARPQVGIVVAEWQGKPYLNIQEPVNTSTASLVQVVAGRVTGPDKNVFVLVRQVGMPTFYVEKATVDRHGRWSAQAHLGSPGSPSGQEFEIRAVAVPDSMVFAHEFGHSLVGLPDGAVVSSPVIVRRGN